MAITQALAAEGVRVIAGARDVGGDLESMSARSSVTPIAVDLATPDGPQKMVDRARAHGALDILVNNVGALAPRLDGFVSITDDQWRDSWTVNFMVAVRMSRAALPMMLERGKGAIVTISSVNAFLRQTPPSLITRPRKPR